MTTRPKAVIVKGNPRYIDGNPKADAFYEELANLLREQGYDPSFDAGEPKTTPDETAALWVGHSRGQDRLRFAPKHIKTLAVDQFEDRAAERRAENDKLMAAAGYKNWADWPAETRPAPPDEHYQVTDKLREALKALAVKTPSTVLAHVAGPSGSGKTTLAKLLASQRPDLRVKDLDDMDFEAERQLGFDSTKKSKYSDEMLKRLYDRRQELLNAYLAEGGGDVVLTGHHLESGRELNFPTKKKYLLDVDAKTSARRGYERSLTEDPKYHRLESDLPSDEKAAQEDIDFLTGKGYSPASAEAILEEFSKKASTYTPLGVPKPAPKQTMKPPSTHHRYLADDTEHEKYAPVGIDGLLAATEKLLAVNRGLADPDDRDSLPNDRVYTVDRLMAERIKLDHGRTLRSMMGRLSRMRNLAPVGPNAFGEYTSGYIKSNPLVPALEEINPMHILEQKLRITKMGPGGIGDPNAITEDMTAVGAAQFGFVDPLAGPESEKAGIDVRLAHGARVGSDGRIYQLLINRRTGKKQWVSPSDMRGKTLKLPD